jgi:hypothetical protein
MVIAKGVFPLSHLGHDAEPLLRLLFCRQLPVVLEDDRWRVASLKRHLIRTLHQSRSSPEVRIVILRRAHDFLDRMLGHEIARA